MLWAKGCGTDDKITTCLKHHLEKQLGKYYNKQMCLAYRNDIKNKQTNSGIQKLEKKTNKY